MKSEYLIKISVIGSCDPLKTNLIQAYTGQKWELDLKPTQGVEIFTKKVIVGESPVKLIIVDTASQMFFGKLRKNYYRGSSACIIVFDKSDLKSFEQVSSWLEDFRNNLDSWTDTSIPIALLSINNKEEKVSSDEGKSLAELLDLPYFETSSPTFENSSQVFQYLAKQVITS